MKFAQKWYFQSKTEKVKIIIEFYLFELVYVPNFTLDKILNRWAKFDEKGISGKKQKMGSAPWNSA